MWQVENRTPFAAAGYFARDRNGAENWVVAVRATFDVRPDGLVDLQEAPTPVRLQPAYADAAYGELLAEADFAPFRPKTDLIVRGTASGMGGKPARHVDVAVAVGPHLRKRVRVHGERWLRRTRTGSLIDLGAPVEAIPLSWTRSLGGPDALDADAPPHPGNPVGTGWTTRWTDPPEGAEIALPNMEHPDAPILAGKPLPEPVGFGAVQPGWHPRIEAAGTYDQRWGAERAPLPPEDFSERFHQAAPLDQVTDLRGGEAVSVAGLHPEGPYAFHLPQIILEVLTRIDRQSRSHRFRLIGVELDATARSVAMIWNASLKCARDIDLEGSTVSVRQMAGVAR